MKKEKEVLQMIHENPSVSIYECLMYLNVQEELINLAQTKLESEKLQKLGVRAIRLMLDGGADLNSKDGILKMISLTKKMKKLQ